MKTAFCGDIHLANHRRGGGEVVAGINQRARLILDTMSSTLALAIREGAGRVVILGDLFDNDHPEPQLIAAAQDVFLKYNIDVILMVGNHEQRSEAIGDHAQQPLRDQVHSLVDSVQELGFGSTALCMMPFSRRETTEYLSSCVQRFSFATKANKVLCGHFGIKDAAVTPHFMQGSPDGLQLSALHPMMRAAGITACFTGHWHEGWMPSGEHTDGLLVCQVGALCPTGWDNPGLRYGNVWIYDDTSNSVVLHRIPGPRFLIDAKDVERAGSNKVFLRLTGGALEADLCRRLLEEGKVYYAECVPDTVAAKAAAQQAAVKARSADTLSAALSGYIGAMSLPEGVSADEVSNRISIFMEQS